MIPVSSDVLSITVLKISRPFTVWSVELLLLMLLVLLLGTMLLQLGELSEQPDLNREHAYDRTASTWLTAEMIAVGHVSSLFNVFTYICTLFYM